MEQLLNNIKTAIPDLKKYEKLVQKWQKAVNLVSNKEINDLWIRHILDSAQVYFYISTDKKIMVDMGSGGGFPGIVIAVLNKCLNGSLEKIYLIESDNKKSIFLQEAARELGLKNVCVINDRIENTNIEKADVVTARALASVDVLLNYGCFFQKNSTEFLFLKGACVDSELKNINNKYSVIIEKNKVNKSGCLLRITEAENNG